MHLERIRQLTQLTWLFLSNSYLAFPFTKSLYQGPLKVLCSPGLNCYSCPGAVLYCPIGSLQQLLVGIRFNLQAGYYFLGLYVLGSLTVLGALFGRFICGWACPFGFFQDLLFKIPTRKFSIPSLLNYGKHVSLFLLVIALPLLVADAHGMGQTWFCKYWCPAGTLEAGIPMLLLVPDLRSAVGMLFYFKLSIAIFYFFWSIAASRPFCRTGCPLGAFYSFFNKYSVLKVVHVAENCTRCKECHKVCPVDINFDQTPDSPECIKCLKCRHEACSFNAIELEIAGVALSQSRQLFNLNNKP